jgi:hypothetical protein
VYSWKEGAPVDEIERGFDELCTLGDDIPGVRMVSWGLNTSEFANGYTHAMIIVGDDAAAVRAYRERAGNHPIAEVARVSEEAGIGVDYSRPA